MTTKYTVSIHDTAQKNIVPIPSEEVLKMYSCGPTVHDYAHIGNFRYFVMVDCLKKVRTLTNLGFNSVSINMVTVGRLRTSIDEDTRNIPMGLKKIMPDIKAIQ